MHYIKTYTDLFWRLMIVRVAQFVIFQSLGYVMPLGIQMVSSVLCVWLIKRKEISFVSYLGWCTALLLGGYVYGVLTYYSLDTGWDSNTYHLEIIIKYLSGFLFFYDSSGVINEYVTYFPKNINVLYSNIAYLFGLESGRFLKILLMMIGGVTYYRMLYKYGRHRSLVHLLVGLLLILNPVVLSQSYTYYIDDVGYFFLLMIVLHALLREYDMVLLISSLYVGSKMSYGVFLVIGICSRLAYILYSKKYLYEKALIIEYISKRKRYRNILLFIMLAVVGLHQYGYNILSKHNPFYPIYGSGKDIITQYIPKDIRSYTTPIQLLVSYMSYPLGACHEDPNCPRLISLSSYVGWKKLITSYNTLSNPDTIVNGFGSLFSFMLLGSFILLIRGGFKNSRSKNLIYLYLIIIIMIASVSLGSIRARFIPFFYAIPLLVVLYTSDTIRQGLSIKIAVYTILGLGLLNMLLITASLVRKYPENMLNQYALDSYISQITYASGQRILYTRSVYDTLNMHRVLNRHYDYIGKMPIQELSEKEFLSLCGVSSFKDIKNTKDTLIRICPNQKVVMRILFGFHTSTYFIIE